MYFWGLRETVANPTWGCPIGLYKSAAAGTYDAAKHVKLAHDNAKLIIWNKVQVFFKVEAAFPSFPTVAGTTYFYRAKVSATSALVLLPSINTNLPGDVTAAWTTPDIVLDKITPPSS